MKDVEVTRDTASPDWSKNKPTVLGQDRKLMVIHLQLIITIIMMMMMTIIIKVIIMII